MAQRPAPAVLLALVPLVFLLLVPAGCGGLAEGPDGETDMSTDLLAEISRFEDRRTVDLERFAELAAHSRSVVRRRAALALGRIGDPRSAPLLKRLLVDADPGVRGEAAFAAGISGIPTLGPVLRRRLSDRDPRVRGLVVQALMRLNTGEDDYRSLTDLLLERIGDSPADDLDSLLGNAWRLKGHQGMIDLLMKWADMPADDGGAKRLSAIYSLSRLGEPQSSLLLTRLLSSDDEPAVRALAARGLGAAFAGDDGSDNRIVRYAALAGILSREEHWLVRVESFNALGRIGYPSNTEELCRALSDEHPQVQTAAIRAAGRMSEVSEESRDRLATLLEATDSSVAPDAAEALARLSDPRGLAWGLEAARSSEPRQRADAAAVLVHAADSDKARSTLRMLLGDESGSVVRTALTAVAGAGRVPDFLEDVTRTLIEDSDPLTRAAAAEALGASGDPASSLPLLLAADRREAEQEDNDCRLSIFGLLEDHPDSHDAVEAVRRGLESPDRLVRQRAAEIMAGWKRGDEVPPGVCEAGDFPPTDDCERAAALAHSRVEAIVDTAGGAVRIELLPREAPLTVLNFIDLAKDGYFDGILFHRVVPGFVVQGGDPEGDGWGGPGHTIRCENNRLEYERGMVGMALSGKDTGGSQFFITLAPQPHLNGRYTIFGRVVEGMDVVDRIRRGERITTVRVAVDPA